MGMRGSFLFFVEQFTLFFIRKWTFVSEIRIIKLECITLKVGKGAYHLDKFGEGGCCFGRILAEWAF